MDGHNNESKKAWPSDMPHAQMSLAIREPSDATTLSHLSSDDEEMPNQSVEVVPTNSTLIWNGELESGESSKGTG